MYKIALCDDEKNFLDIEEKIIKEYFEEHCAEVCVEKFSSARELLVCDDLEKFDVYFLDVEMPEKGGLSLAEDIFDLKNNAKIVFVSAYIKYAPEGYKVSAVRYIVKKISEMNQAIFECLDEIVKRIQAETKTFEFNFIEGKRVLHENEIIYVNSELRKLHFHVCEGGKLKEYTCIDKLDNTQEYMKSANMIRVHQSYLVNAYFITDISRYKAALDINGMQEKIPVAQMKYENTIEKWLFYKREK